MFATFLVIGSIPFVNLWVNNYVNRRDQKQGIKKLDQWISEQAEYDHIIDEILKSNDIIKHDEQTKN